MRDTEDGMTHKIFDAHGVVVFQNGDRYRVLINGTSVTRHILDMNLHHSDRVKLTLYLDPEISPDYDNTTPAIWFTERPDMTKMMIVYE